jgi:hypothetical protein
VTAADVHDPAEKTSETTGFVVAGAGASAAGVLRVHQMADAFGARLPEREGSEAQVPLTDGDPTGADPVQSAVPATCHASTRMLDARADP